MEHVGEPSDGGNDGLAPSVSIVSGRNGAHGVVVVSGEIDLDGGDALEAAVAALVADGVSDVSIKAEGVRFIDSSGLGGLLAARAAVLDAGGELHFGPVPDNVARVIDLAGVSDLLGPSRPPPPAEPG